MSNSCIKLAVKSLLKEFLSKIELTEDVKMATSFIEFMKNGRRESNGNFHTFMYFFSASLIPCSGHVTRSWILLRIMPSCYTLL